MTFFALRTAEPYVFRLNTENRAALGSIVLRPVERQALNQEGSSAREGPERGGQSRSVGFRELRDRPQRRTRGALSYGPPTAKSRSKLETEGFRCSRGQGLSVRIRRKQGFKS